MKFPLLFLILLLTGCDEQQLRETGLALQTKSERVILTGKYSKCEIEYVPLEKRYYPKYDGKYFWYESWRLWGSKSYSKFALDSIGAMRILDEFLSAPPDTTTYLEYKKSEK